MALFITGFIIWTIVERKYHSHTIFVINPMATFAAHKGEARFKKQLLGRGGSHALLLRQHAPLNLR
jgi:hypothetical protein